MWSRVPYTQIKPRKKDSVEWIEKDGGQGQCIGDVRLSDMVAGFMFEALFSHIVGYSNGMTMCGGTIGRMLNIGNACLAGIGWWQIF